MKTQKNISQEEWVALAKKYFGNRTEEELKVLNKEIELLDKSDIASVEELVEKINLNYKLNRFEPGKAFQTVQAKIRKEEGKPVKRMNQSYWIGAAAILLLAFITGSLWVFNAPDETAGINPSGVYVDDYGVSKVELPDGSVVSLNRGTKINYPERFDKDVREVSIEGEAFFEVRPNPDKPFIIHAGDASIEVLGTSFNVNAYPGHDQVEVVVTTGKVSVYEGQEKQSANRLTLDPGDKGVYVHNSKDLLKMANDDPNYLAWKTRHLIFKDSSLKEVFAQLEKLYRIEIKTSGTDINDLPYTGHFENQSVDFILEVIALTYKIELAKENDRYILSKRS